MRTSRTAALAAATALAASATLLVSGSAAADAPPPTWDPARHRTLVCDTGTVEGQWARGGPFTAFLIQGSTDVIVAKRAVVRFPDGTVYTPVAVPGFDVSNAVTHCTYTDPAGLDIELWGLRS